MLKLEGLYRYRGATLKVGVGLVSDSKLGGRLETLFLSNSLLSALVISEGGGGGGDIFFDWPNLQPPLPPPSKANWSALKRGIISTTFIPLKWIVKACLSLFYPAIEHIFTKITRSVFRCSSLLLLMPLKSDWIKFKCSSESFKKTRSSGTKGQAPLLFTPPSSNHEKLQLAFVSVLSWNVEFSKLEFYVYKNR